MELFRGAGLTGSPVARSRGGWSDENSDELGASPREKDWKKLVLIVGLGLLSWVATYIGMLELIEANLGELPLIHKIVIAFSVGMLMTMIIWLLDQMFAPIPPFTKLLYIIGYLFLTVISVGFGFGFYWKVLESRSEASRSAESAVTQVQGALFAASTRLDQLQSTLETLTSLSRQKSEIERANGTSCPNSMPGDGPRRKMREDDAARFSFAGDFVKGRAKQVKADIAGLDGDLAKIVKDDKSTIDPRTGNRNEFMKGLGRKLELTVTGFNAFRTDPQLKQIRADLAERAEKASFPDTRGGSYACPDAQLQTALRGVVRAIDGLPDIEKPKIAAVEGSEATIEAFRRLTATFYGLLSFKLPPSADDLRELQKKAVQSVENPQGGRGLAFEQAGLSKRDYVPLAVAIFVDLCLLLVSMGRPINRLQGLLPKMQAAERGPVYQILSRFSDIHNDVDIRKKFEMFRHVVFDFNGDYYIAVPLDAPRRQSPKEVEALQLEAHLLANLFASFEKERIFTRVYNPLLGTRSIQKKLWRQGSKFAGSNAFRVYRFRDGAWSEIILGAVMGAARRVEQAQRARRADREGDSAPEPALGPLSERITQSRKTAERDRRFELDDAELELTPEASRGAFEPRADPRFEAAFGRYALSAQTEQTGEPAGTSERARRWSFPIQRPAPPIPEADVTLERAGDRQRQGDRQPSQGEAEHDEMGAEATIGSGTADINEQPAPSKVIDFPGGGRSQPPARASLQSGELDVRLPGFLTDGPAASAPGGDIGSRDAGAANGAPVQTVVQSGPGARSTGPEAGFVPALAAALDRIAHAAAAEPEEDRDIER